MFEEAMDDDFNTADAVTAIFEIVKFANVNINENSSKAFVKAILDEMVSLCDILGIKFTQEEKDPESEEIEALIEERQQARKNKDWATADRIRDELSARGIVLKDTPSGVQWSRG